jgi:hypothetical protein
VVPDNSSPTYRYRTKVSYDRQTSLVSVAFPSLNSSGACDLRLVFHVGTKAWGRADATVEATMNFIAPGVTINGLTRSPRPSTRCPTSPSMRSIGSAGGTDRLRTSTPRNQLVSLNGLAVSSSFTTGDVGDDDQVTMVDKLRVRWHLQAATATATGLYKFTEGDALSTGPTNAVNDGKFDLRQSGRFHRFRVDMTGRPQGHGLRGQTIPVGTR